ncbi:hypothetical protein TeGR_g8674, partial [Tetraparma gracilis]
YVFKTASTKFRSRPSTAQQHNSRNQVEAFVPDGMIRTVDSKGRPQSAPATRRRPQSAAQKKSAEIVERLSKPKSAVNKREIAMRTGCAELKGMLLTDRALKEQLDALDAMRGVRGGAKKKGAGGPEAGAKDEAAEAAATVGAAVSGGAGGAAGASPGAGGKGGGNTIFDDQYAKDQLAGFQRKIDDHPDRYQVNDIYYASKCSSTPLDIGDLNLTPDAEGNIRGFIPWAINVVWVPDSTLRLGHVVGAWREYNFDPLKATWSFTTVGPDTSAKDFPKVLLDSKGKDTADRTAPANYRANYKMVWLCHHRGFHCASTTSPSSSHQLERTRMLDAIGFPKRRLLDREHLMDVTFNVGLMVAGAVVMFQPCVSSIASMTAAASSKQSSLSPESIAEIDVDAVHESRSEVGEDYLNAGLVMVILLEFMAASGILAITEKNFRQVWWYACLERGLMIDFRDETKGPPQQVAQRVLLSFPALVCYVYIAVLGYLLGLGVRSDTQVYEYALNMAVSLKILYEMHAQFFACFNVASLLVPLPTFFGTNPDIARKILEDTTRIKEVHALQRLGDCARWQHIMLARWCETQRPPLRWNYKKHRPKKKDLKRDKKVKLAFEEQKRLYAFNFGMLELDAGVFPKGDVLESSARLPYSLEYASCLHWVFDGVYKNIPNKSPGLSLTNNPLTRNFSPLAALKRVTRWSNTESLVFPKCKGGGEGSNVGGRQSPLAVFAKHAYVSLYRGEQLFEHAFDYRMVKAHSGFLLTVFTLGILLCVGYADYILESKILPMTDDFADMCETKNDCSGTVCLRDTGRDLTFLIGNGVCDNNGTRAFLNATGEWFNSTSFSLDCKELAFDGGDCL